MSNAPVTQPRARTSRPRTTRRSGGSSPTRAATSPRLVRSEIALAKSELKVSGQGRRHSASGCSPAPRSSCCWRSSCCRWRIAYFIHMTGLDLAWCFLIVFVALRPDRRRCSASSASARSSRSRPPSGPSTRRRRPRTSSSVADGSRAARSRIVEIPGPWQHRHVAANGARFHVAEAGPSDGPLVVLLHGFPEFWWTWRDQAAGARRGGLPRGRDGPARLRRLGQDPERLRPDHPGPGRLRGGQGARRPQRGARRARLGRVRRLGDRRAARARGLGPVRRLGAAPQRRCWPRSAARRGAAACGTCLAMQLPVAPERRLADPSQRVPARPPARLERPRVRRSPTAATVATYERAIGLWPSSHCALEYHRWLFRSRLRADGRRFRAADAAAGLASRCSRSPAPTTRHCRPSGVAALPRPRRGRAHRARDARGRPLPARGTRPGEFTATLLDWLAALPAGSGAVAGVDGAAAGQPAGRRVGDLVGGQRVAGVAVGHRGREDHAEHLAGRRHQRAAGVARAAPGPAASRPRARRCRRRRCRGCAAAARRGSGRPARCRGRPAGSRAPPPACRDRPLRSKRR